MLRYENTNLGHNKFYEVELEVQELPDKKQFLVKTWRGKIGAKPKPWHWAFESREAAQKEIEHIHATRIKHGYQIIS